MGSDSLVVPALRPCRLLPNLPLKDLQKAGPEAIIPLRKASGFGAQITVNAPVTINGTAGSQSDLGAFLAEHAKTIAREVQPGASNRVRE